MFYDNRGTMSGGLSVSLSGPNGSCIGGAVCGSLIAAGHVQVRLFSYLFIVCVCARLLHLCKVGAIRM